MLKFIRHSHPRLRLWLLAAAAMLVLTSVIEAGHMHGVFTEVDDHCVLCQHSASLDKTPLTQASIALPTLIMVLGVVLLLHTVYCQQHSFTPIRAPPQLRRTH